MNIKIKEIRLSEFDLSLSEMRVMNQSRMGQLEKSMRLHGQLQPVVARVYEGGVQMIDGFKSYVYKSYIRPYLPPLGYRGYLWSYREHQGKLLQKEYEEKKQRKENKTETG